MESALRQWSRPRLRVLASNLALRRTLIVAFHLVGIVVAYQLAFALRFDFRLPDPFQAVFRQTLPAALIAYMLPFWTLRLFSGLWSYYSLDDVLRTGAALLIGSGLLAVFVFAMQGLSFRTYPRSIFVTNFMLLGLWVGGGRLLVRWMRRVHRRLPGVSTNGRCVVVGDTASADMLLRDAARLKGNLGSFLAVVTDQPDAIGMRLHGVKVRGPLSEVGRIASACAADTLLILPPYAGPGAIRVILDTCAEAKVHCAFRAVPGLGDLASGRFDVSLVREIDVEDLLPREPNTFDPALIRNFLSGRRVLVTGAGGSIGSELCRQIARADPAMLVLFENSEFALYTIDGELAELAPHTPRLAVTGDVRRADDLHDAIARAGGVDVILHAAAYKHVHLMERNIAASCDNNVLGSATLAEVAESAGVRRVVLISSDKAVRPTSVMGATKRLAERVLLERPARGTEFLAVRFGNVLGSSGSVIPLFKRQIAAGGPVTVTTPDTRRFFMTIPEAVELVLNAGAVGQDRDLLVLEMGEPVRILDLARNMIELSGYLPGEDIEIRFVGLRPGEKEYEELLTRDENVVRTEHEKLWVVRREGAPSAPEVDLTELRQAIAGRDPEALRALITRWVPDHLFAAEGETGAA
jgi:FlaA1/EpsC-like NDP-sugar epimerase